MLKDKFTQKKGFCPFPNPHQLFRRMLQHSFSVILKLHLTFHMHSTQLNHCSLFLSHWPKNPTGIYWALIGSNGNMKQGWTR